jgi:hypothetical protein
MRPQPPAVDEGADGAQGGDGAGPAAEKAGVQSAGLPASRGQAIRS